MNATCDVVVAATTRGAGGLRDRQKEIPSIWTFCTKDSTRFHENDSNITMVVLLLPGNTIQLSRDYGLEMDS
jgi:hypothetical protein